jgi:hypothetical protein
VDLETTKRSGVVECDNVLEKSPIQGWAQAVAASSTAFTQPRSPIACAIREKTPWLEEQTNAV